MRTRGRAGLAVSAFYALWATAAVAQSGHTYGTKDSAFYRLNPGDFVPFSGGVTYFNTGGTLYGSNVGGSAFFASVHLPSGALLTSVELDGCDTDSDTKLVLAHMFQCDAVGQNCQTVADLSVDDNVGCQSVTHDLTLDPTAFVNDSAHQLIVQVTTESGTGTTSLRGIVVGYKLQVSPAPATATFGDVPTGYLYFRAIEALAASGITQGCGSGNFCPDQPVTRGELAKFLANALGLHWQ
jgi:hypothetical protein